MTNSSSTKPEPALEMIRITKDFPGVRALDNVSLAVRHGEVHSLIGENGAGKSTLMKILDGVFPAGSYSGQIILEGSPVALRSPHDAKAKGIGFVPQEITVLESLSVAENIFIGRWVKPGGIVVRFKELFERAAGLLEQGGIQLDPGQPVSSLGTSERQLVMIARALAGNPPVLILDEPTSALTRTETENLFRLIRRRRERGGAVIFITHKLGEVLELADRATVLRDGAVVAEFQGDALSQNQIIAAMVGRKIENLFPARDSEIGKEECLQVENLGVPHPRITGRNALEEINFSVRRGEILGLAGLVGSGRSEIVNALYGRLPHSGRVFVEGKLVRPASPKRAKAAGIGLLTEDRKTEGLLFNFGIRENMTISSLDDFARWRVLGRRAETRAARDSMEKLGIRASSPETKVGALSGGNQQKVLLARVLMTRPKVLLLDEPTKGVDVGAKHEIYKLMIALAGAGIAIIFVSSELPELLAMSDRVVVLAGGRIRDQFTKAEADERRLMRAATGDS